MATPDSFTYCWSDLGTNKLYVGVHKGTPDDGYVCSSKPMLEEYTKRPNDFSRQIIAFGTFKEMYVLETAILKAAGANADPGYYNLSNNTFPFHDPSAHAEFMLGKQYKLGKTGYKHTTKARRAISDSLLGNKRGTGYRWSKDQKDSLSQRKLGLKHTEVTCPFCQKTGGSNVMLRWHFDKCKIRTV
jgi:hypothetical protein